MTVVAKNPIMSGFYPDPSICAVGEDYYLINSTFAYFPGLPIMHSKDLVHWEQIGNAMDRASQLPLEKAGHSQGLFAPTIRYHEGTYYVICTNVSHGGNYIITAKSPEGPWSEPYYLQGAQGIDPSLFFDDDGTCYYIGTRPNQEGCRYNGDYFIWIQEVDLKEMKLIGEPKDVWNGAMRDVVWPEGPHLYKKNGYYYIMHAEGGTGPDHAVTVCRSRNVWGPYENNKCNPILTHRHLGWAYPIKYVGHADMIETPKGDWYMVMLAVRPLEGYTTMGRETFLATVTWENDWPVVNPGVGMLTDKVEINLDPWYPEKDRKSYTVRTGSKTAVPGSNRQYDFGKMKQLGHEFLMLRNPAEDMCELVAKEGLKLKFGKAKMTDAASPSFVGIRQQHHHFMVGSWLSMEGIAGDRKAGIVLLQSNEYQLRLEASEKKIEAILCEKGQDNCIGMTKMSDVDVVLFMMVDGLKATLGIEKGEEEIIIAKDIDIRALSTEVAGGFVGCTIGMYAVDESAEEADSGAKACFRGFTYESM